MRKITKNAVDAFMNKKRFVGTNTEVGFNPLTKRMEMYLHGNLIAWVEDGALIASNCGWNSRTTVERLHHLILEWTKGAYGYAQRKGGKLLEYMKDGSVTERDWINGMRFYPN